MGQVRIAYHRAYAHPMLRRGFDAVQRQAADVDHHGRPFHVQLHQVEQRRAARQEPDRRALAILRVGSRAHRLGHVLGPPQLEHFHDRLRYAMPRRACRTAARMFL